MELDLQFDKKKQGFSTEKRIVLAGNPNVGKSIFFKELTGIYAEVSNYPGTTLEITYGHYQDYLVIDTPGVYGVSAFNEEEVVARDIILTADLIVNVVDGVHLDRDLFLTQQLIDLGIPVIVALNMMDEVKKQGLEIDAEELAKRIGVSVVPTVATTGEGVAEIKQQLEKACLGKSSKYLEQRLEKLMNKGVKRQEALLILEGDEELASQNGVKVRADREEIYHKRRQRVDRIVDQVVKWKEAKNSFASLLNTLLLKPIPGIPTLLLILYGVYQLIGVFIAQTVVDFTEGIFFAGIYEPLVKSLIANILSLDSLIGQILAGEFGLLTMTITYLLGLLMPLVFSFYFVLSIMEDSGYLPRVAVLADKTLTKLGLNGRAVIPLILGFGCVTMAIITTRMLGSERERKIATLLLGLAIPCSAQLGVIIVLLASLGYGYFLFYLMIISLVFLLAGKFLNSTLKGESTELFIDLPPLRWPKLNNIMTKTFNKTRFFVEEAGPIFFLGSLLITLLDFTGGLNLLQNLFSPVVVNWLQLPSETAVVFIMGVIRRDFGAAGLTSLSLTGAQTLVGLVTMTLFVPCIASIMIIFKERNWKEASLIWIGSWIVAFVVGGLVAQILV
ncbi:ferrous iron transport protein B [Fuchsiella alkaliacetigena]|uniref:ferrous iron transport protein B n=1 Tax=Fuchsiella alkaliacetigena TaxID=957042 RepID=UPI00200A16A3|nr:ferrous iron transport protein B [Fuchsiella alkaliacetigena]MCK8825276.1 ferrous iron transport protein B [Fuchsiella alkaliacetigena]